MKRRSPVLVIAAALAVLALVPQGPVWHTGARFTDAQAVGGNTFTTGTWCSAPGPQTVLANRDAQIAQQTPTNNFGGLGTLSVVSRNSNRNVRSLIGFTLPSMPAGCTVTAATLRVFATSAQNGRTIQARQVNGAWTENAVTWNNQPGTTATLATSASGTGWRTWTVTTIVQNQYAGTNHGFLLQDATEDGGGGGFTQVYTSREGAANDPELIVTFG